MMKLCFKSLLVFAALSFVFSSSFGCRNSTSTGESGDNADRLTDGDRPQSTTQKIDESTKVDEDGYPSPPAKIAEAEFKLLKGGTFSVPESKGKVVLINLWATWCGPCLKEMPALVAMQEKYRDKGFEIIGLDTDPETADQINAFAEKMNLNYKLGWADRETVSEFFKWGQMNAIPQSFLINRDGKWAGLFQGGSDRVVRKMEETVEKIVNE